MAKNNRRKTKSKNATLPVPTRGGGGREGGRMVRRGPRVEEEYQWWREEVVGKGNAGVEVEDENEEGRGWRRDRRIIPPCVW
jgi:hypothetical protein